MFIILKEQLKDLFSCLVLVLLISIGITCLAWFGEIIFRFNYVLLPIFIKTLSVLTIIVFFGQAMILISNITALNILAKIFNTSKNKIAERMFLNKN